MDESEKDEIEKLLRMPKEKRTLGQKSADWLTGFADCRMSLTDCPPLAHPITNRHPVCFYICNYLCIL